MMLSPGVPIGLDVITGGTLIGRDVITGGTPIGRDVITRGTPIGWDVITCGTTMGQDVITGRYTHWFEHNHRGLPINYWYFHPFDGRNVITGRCTLIHWTGGHHRGTTIGRGVINRGYNHGTGILVGIFQIRSIWVGPESEEL